MAAADGLLVLAAGALLGLRRRLVLAAREFDAELARAGSALLAMLFIAICAALCLAAAGALVVAYWWETARLQALAGVAVAFGAAAALGGWRLHKALAKPPTLLALAVLALLSRRPEGGQQESG